MNGYLLRTVQAANINRSGVGMQRVVWLIGLVLLFGLNLWAAEDLLKTADVHRVMEQLLEYHVQVKELTPALLRRSYEVYLQQFDPNRLYLTEGEVRPYLEPTPAELDQAFARYTAGDLSDYMSLDEVIQKGILRARGWRPELEKAAEKRILSHEPEVKRRSCPRPLYCRSEEHLRDRQEDFLVQIAKQRLASHKTQPEREVIAEAWALYAKQATGKENAYLYLDSSGRPLNKEKRQHFVAMRTLKALAQSLDSHTAYYSPAEAYQLRMQLQRGSTGIGLEIEDSPRGVVVARLIPGGPAEKSGKVQVGDRIVEVDSQSVASVPVGDVITRLRGPKGSKVILGIERKADEKDSTLQVTLTREPLPATTEDLASTYQYFGEGLIGVIRLDSFYDGTGVSSESDVKKAINDFKSRGKLEGLVLDLRLNLGGFLSQAVKVAGLFITGGVIAISKYSDGVEVYFRDIKGVAEFDGPLVILTSKASASAAEIVAQALQDYGQALIVGDPRTYGKGSIQHQTVTDEDAEDYFKVTVGKYYTVSGRSTQVRGVEADIVVPTILYEEMIGEEYLEYPLEPDQIEPAYDDTLQDLDPTIRQWFIRYYLPSLQKRRTLWQQHLPQLKQNSEHRLKTSRNFQLFLQTIREEGGLPLMTLEGNPAPYGKDDLQLIEAINILKDMIILHSAHAQDAA